MPKEKLKFSDKYDFSNTLIGIRILFTMIFLFGITAGAVAIIAPILLFFTMFFLLIFLFV